MCVVVLCFCSVVSVSASETVDYNYLVSNYDINHDTEAEPFNTEETDPPQTDEPTETPTETTKNIIVSNGLVNDILLCIGLDLSELNPNTQLYRSCVILAVGLVIGVVYMILKCCTSFFRGGRL